MRLGYYPIEGFISPQVLGKYSYIRHSMGQRRMGQFRGTHLNLERKIHVLMALKHPKLLSRTGQ